MSANPSRGMTEKESLPSERLDENTEMMVSAVLAERDAPYGGYFLTNKVLAALRSRIRSLIEEGVIQLGEMTHVDYDDD